MLSHWPMAIVRQNGAELGRGVFERIVVPIRHSALIFGCAIVVATHVVGEFMTKRVVSGRATVTGEGKHIVLVWFDIGPTGSAIIIISCTF
jgi:ABC-type spermidine/putrescine transport system permease subunit I